MRTQYKPVRSYTVFSVVGVVTVQAYSIKEAARRFMRVKKARPDSILPGKLAF